MKIGHIISFAIILGLLIGGTVAALHAQPQLRQLQIDADARAEEAKALLSSLALDSRQAIGQSVVPVFLPRSASSSVVSIQARENSTLVHLESMDYQLSLKGTRVRRDRVRAKASTSREPIDKSISYDRNEVGLWYATWAEGDATYRMVLECREASRALCADASVIRALVADLILIGGTGDR